MEEKMELERRGEDEKHIPWDKLLGVAILGAVGSAVLYYVFIKMDVEMREKIKNQVWDYGKKAMANFKNPGETEV